MANNVRYFILNEDLKNWVLRLNNNNNKKKNVPSSQLLSRIIEILLQIPRGTRKFNIGFIRIYFPFFVFLYSKHALFVHFYFVSGKFIIFSSIVFVQTTNIRAIIYFLFQKWCIMLTSDMFFCYYWFLFPVNRSLL